MSASPTRNSTTETKLDTAYLESLFQGAGLAIIACEPDGAIVACNAKASKLFRGGAGLREGAAVVEQFPETDRPAIIECLQHCREKLENIELRTKLCEAKSAAVEYFVLFTPVLEGDGSLRGIALWFRDISSQVRMARVLKKRERLTSLGNLSGAVAHHYNNLLCSIGTSIEYAMNMNTMTAMRRALLRSNDAIRRATEITQQLLAFAQADHRATDLADLTEIVLYYFDQNEARLRNHNVRLEFDPQPIATCPVRREPLLVILNNLVDNAIDAMTGGGTLSVTLAPHGEKNVRLSITDSGGGFSDEDLEHLFEPFYTTKGELVAGSGRNAGMGLAVAHGLVNEMRGSITASNVAGRGARFDVVLPVGESH